MLRDRQGRPVPVLARATITANGELLAARSTAHILPLAFKTSGAAALLLLLAGAAATVLATRAQHALLERIVALDGAMASIAKGHLDAPLPRSGSGDELDHIAAAIAAMVDRLRLLIEQQKALADQIMHELRTPLARAHIHVARMAEDGTADPARIESLKRDLSGIAGTVEDMLEISAIEAGRADESAREVIRLRSFVDQTLELFEDTADENDVVLRNDVPPDAEVAAVPAMLRRLLVNLLDNALRHTPSGGTIMISGEDGLILSVTNTGSAFPEGALPHIFERFVNGAGQGAPRGLGLAFVKAISVHHGWAVEASNEEARAVVRVRPTNAR
jgi:signal transduction histidine kinase